MQRDFEEHWESLLGYLKPLGLLYVPFHWDSSPERTLPAWHEVERVAGNQGHDCPPPPGSFGRVKYKVKLNLTKIQSSPIPVCSTIPLIADRVKCLQGAGNHTDPVVGNPFRAHTYAPGLELGNLRDANEVVKKFRTMGAGLDALDALDAPTRAGPQIRLISLGPSPG